MRGEFWRSITVRDWHRASIIRTSQPACEYREIFGWYRQKLYPWTWKSIWKVFQEIRADQIPLDRKIRWLQEAAEGIRDIYDNGMTHADTGYLNMILVQGSLKIIDFEGAPFVLESYDSIWNPLPPLALRHRRFTKFLGILSQHSYSLQRCQEVFILLVNI